MVQNAVVEKFSLQMSYIFVFTASVYGVEEPAYAGVSALRHEQLHCGKFVAKQMTGELTGGFGHSLSL